MKAILIGRFQTPVLSDVLKGLVGRLIREHDLAGIVIGNNKTGATRVNPLDLESRMEMLQKEFGSTKILSIDDHPSDHMWSANLDEQIRKVFSGDMFVLYGSDDGFIARYSGKFKVSSTGQSHHLQVKDNSLSRDDSDEFRRGVFHATARTYPKVYPTVDIAVFRNERKELLLGMKGIEKKWRFLGGFSDPTDDNFEAAAKRELQEECGLTEITSPAYERSFKVADWRYRQEEDKIITILFSADYISGDAVGNDDIEEVRWFSIAEVSELVSGNAIAPEHRPLFEFLLRKYSR